MIIRLFISAVHEVLTDAEKRAVYDQFGEAGLDGSHVAQQPTYHHHHHPGHFHFDFGDMFAHEQEASDDTFRFQFNDFFNDETHFRSGHRAGQNARRQNFHFDFEDDFFGHRQQQQQRKQNRGE